MLKRQSGLLSEEAYLQQEAASPIRQEYVDGAVYAMTGGTLRHNLITLNFASLLRGHLRGTPCRVFMSDAKLRVAKQNAYYYPDVMVSCAVTLQTLTGAEVVIDTPVLLVEVTSPSSEGIDRREKLVAYRTLPSLKEYVLIAQDRPEIEIHTRLSDTSWEITHLAPGDPVVFGSIDLSTDFATLYEESGVDL